MHLTSYVIVSLVLSQICKGVGMPLQYLNKYIKNGNVLPFNSFIYSWWSTWSPVIQDWFKFNSPRSPFYKLHFLVLIALKRLIVSTNLFPIELVFSGFSGLKKKLFSHFCQTLFNSTDHSSFTDLLNVLSTLTESLNFKVCVNRLNL